MSACDNVPSAWHQPLPAKAPPLREMHTIPTILHKSLDPGNPRCRLPFRNDTFRFLFRGVVWRSLFHVAVDNLIPFAKKTRAARPRAPAAWGN